MLLSETVISPVQVEPEGRLLGPPIELAQGSLDPYYFVVVVVVCLFVCLCI